MIVRMNYGLMMKKTSSLKPSKDRVMMKTAEMKNTMIQRMRKVVTMTSGGTVRTGGTVRVKVQLQFTLGKSAPIFYVLH